MHDGDALQRRVRVRIEGRVQGVGFRYWTQTTAIGLGLRGWVRNRRDASVETVFVGAAGVVDAMLARCREGPNGAGVLAVTIIDTDHATAADLGAFSGFEIRPTV